MKGRLKVTKFRGVDVILDTDELFQDKGLKASDLIFQRDLAKYLYVLSALLLFVPLIILILTSELSISEFNKKDNVFFLIPTFSIYPFIAAKYLSRSRELFYDKLNLLSFRKDIKKISKNEIKELVLNDYFSFELKKIFDNAYFHKKNTFVVDLFEQLLSYPDIRIVLEKRLGVEVGKLWENVLKQSSKDKFKLQNSFNDVLVYLLDDAVKTNSENIDRYTLLFVLNKYFLLSIYFEIGVGELELEGLKQWHLNENKRREYSKIWSKLSKLKPKDGVNRAFTSKPTPTIDQYAENFTKVSSSKNFTLTIGKEAEMISMMDILERSNNACVMLIGEPGVGKTRFIKHFASRMIVEDVPQSLRDHRMSVFDLNKLYSIAETVENFKKILISIFNEAKGTKNMILVFEEFSQILNIREDIKMEVINLITNSVEAMNLKIIATTTSANYSRFIQPIKALSNLFVPVKLNEPPSNLALQILVDELPNLENKYKIEIKLNAVKRIIEFSNKFDMDRVMPDKGIDLLEECCISGRNEGLKFVNVDLVDRVLSQKIGVTVGSISSEESSKLLALSDIMHKRVVGQDVAIDSVVAAIKRARSGLTNSKRPIASFLFFGPTGVGKTEVAKTLAEVYYGSEKLLNRVDMSEYQEEANLKRLIGETDSWGNFSGGFLTELVRSRPFSVILLDEIEKANAKVLDLFLQVLDEGFLTDGAGRKVDFTNTIIIMTSNVGSKVIADLISKGIKYNEVEKEAMVQLREAYRIEFLNRFDKLVMFKPLSKLEIQTIVSFNLQKIKDNLLTKGIEISWNEDTLIRLAELGYNPIYGARELRRVVQENIENRLADAIISGQAKSGSEIMFEGLNLKV